VLSVTSDDGRPPLAVPVWYGYQPGGDVYFFTGASGRRARKAALIEKAGVLSLTVQNPEVPYKYVTVEGTVVRADRPPAAEQMLAVAGRYLPAEMAQGFVEAELSRPDSHLVLYTVRPDRWLTADFTDG
jgi:nitroimidazol reductase NimA-like FMN-containing flavoprotein (pyridoxamine 5'-phosphate oxidase superfamily)